ncbi:MAG TPA: dephospho-CoA kinase [Spirochaetia bacterium]|nr:dephospho-CoA kinase [Spirochaetia bacterium]
MVIGLTGRYCAGKGAAARVFASIGYRVVDADDLSHEVMAEKAEEVIAAFGPAVRGREGGVDRRALGRIVFGDPSAQSRLQAILYPSITARIMRFIAEADGDVVINAPLLQRAGLQKICDAVVFVRAPALVRLARAMRRDGLRLGEAWMRINAQKDVRPQSNDPGVDTYSVMNWGSLRSLERRTLRLARRLKG